MSGKTKQPKVVSIHAHRRVAIAPVVGTRLGRVVELSPEKGLVVDYDGNAAGPRSAQSTVKLSARELEALVASGQPVLLAFAGECADSPIVVGVVQPLPPARADRPGAPVRAVIDGDEVVLEGKEQVELRCGKASIVLTKAGKVLVNGTYISSHSTGVHRIRGGHVEVN